MPLLQRHVFFVSVCILLVVALSAGIADARRGKSSSSDGKNRQGKGTYWRRNDFYTIWTCNTANEGFYSNYKFSSSIRLTDDDRKKVQKEKQTLFSRVKKTILNYWERDIKSKNARTRKKIARDNEEERIRKAENERGRSRDRHSISVEPIIRRKKFLSLPTSIQ